MRAPSHAVSGCGFQSRARPAEREPACAARPPDSPASRLGCCTPRVGWRQRPCPACKAEPGELCCTPTGRRAGRPHTARLGPARRELLVGEQVWQELGRWGADVALVRFSGGGGNPGSIGAVTLESAGERELARWESAEGELARGARRPDLGPVRTVPRPPSDHGDRDVGRAPARSARGRQARARETRRGAPWTARVAHARHVARHVAARQVAGCRSRVLPIPVAARPEARYCSKRCRQAASRARLRERSGRSALAPPERCARCEGPMPAGVRPEARYCSKRCRQAASRARLALASGQATPSDTSRDVSPPTGRRRSRTRA